MAWTEVSAVEAKKSGQMNDRVHLVTDWAQQRSHSDVQLGNRDMVLPSPERAAGAAEVLDRCPVQF